MTGSLVEIAMDEPGWDIVLPDLADIADQAARMALEGAGVAPRGYEIALLATSNDGIRDLNREFRSQDKPTNVLSWPVEDLSPDVAGAPPRTPAPAVPDRPAPLGDLAIALQTCRAEAEAASIPLKNHATHLILHGCLHLLGYDHETEADAERMEGIERAALASAGIPDPYA